MVVLARIALRPTNATPRSVWAGYACSRRSNTLQLFRLYSYLSQPLQVGDLTMRNRNIMASLTRNRSSPPTVLGEVNRVYYAQRAQGGCGLILSEGALISHQGSEWPNAPGIWAEEQAMAWKKITDSVHEAGGLIFCQLWHIGRMAHPDMPEQRHSSKPVLAPSAIAARGGRFRDLPSEPGYVTPTSLEDPWDIVEEFRHAALMAKRAGFDGVELHSASGFLIHQFIDSGSNKRTDVWGGTVENRCKLGLEVLKVLVEIWGAGRVGVKITPTGGYNDIGMPLPETIPTFTYYISKIAAMKLAYVQLVRYVHAQDPPLANPNSKSGLDAKYKRGVPHDVIAVYGPLIKPPATTLQDHHEELIRGSAMPSSDCSRNPVPTRLFVNGGFTPQEADRLIAKGIVDGVAFGHLWIGNPDLQERIEAGLDVGGKGINDYPDEKTFYQAPRGDPNEGYTDYRT